MATFSRVHCQQKVAGSSTSRPAAFTSARPAVQRRSSVQVRADGAAAAPAAAAPAAIEKSMTAMKPVLDIEAIKGVLPHRWGLARY